MAERSADEPEITVDLTPMEARFERVRRTAGFILAPAAFALVWWLSFPSLSGEAHRLAAIMAAVVVLWTTEALPLAATALLGAAACVVLQVAKATAVFAPFADPLMFLFIGSFMLARAIFLHGLDRRVAFGVLSMRWVGGRPTRMLFGFGLVTVLLSGWISNTATTVMMFAIGMSILRFLFRAESEGGIRIDHRYATGMMLMTSFAASVGGLATPVGTPPNLIGLGQIRELTGVDISFFDWCLIGYPIVIALFLFMVGYFTWLCPAGVKTLPRIGELLEHEHRKLGPWTSGQRSTVIAFGATLAMWLIPGALSAYVATSGPHWQPLVELHATLQNSLPEAVASLLGALLLFVLPGNREGRAITWREAAEIDWGVVLLYGGGVALGTLARDTGLVAAIGTGLNGLMPESNELMLVIVAAATGALVSEATSNTAAATIVVPLILATAIEAHIDPLAPGLAATFGSSLGFMLPVSTPCNAIVYGSGYIPIGRMIRYGLLLDVAGVVVVVVVVTWLTPWIR